MLTGKKLTNIILLFIIISTISSVAQAKSVYVINNTETSEMRAYKIDGTSLVYQTHYSFISETLPIGIAIDESVYGQFLFVTFENKNKIELVNAKTMKYVNTVTAPQANNLAGIIFYSAKQKLRNALYIRNLQTHTGHKISNYSIIML